MCVREEAPAQVEEEEGLGMGRGAAEQQYTRRALCWGSSFVFEGVVCAVGCGALLWRLIWSETQARG